MVRTDGDALIPGIMQSAINSFNSNEIKYYSELGVCFICINSC